MTRQLSYVTLLSCVLLFLMVACEKGEDAPDPVTDIEGNIYETVRIGEQVWMAENLSTTRLNDGTEIKLIIKSQEWHNTDDPALSWYNNDSALFKVPYGALYNGYAAENEKICPEGWHVPDNEEFRKLVESQGDTSIAGGKIKVEGITQWHSPNIGADNSSLFTALPAGMRYFEGTFSSLSYFTAFWSTTSTDISLLDYMSLSYLDSKAVISSRHKNHGFSIRCIRD
jgi:uncharacterized protein (TIGR02145 family)